VKSHSAFASLVLLAAGGQVIADTPSPLLGRWILVSGVTDCRSATLEFTAGNHLKLTSGAQTLEAAIEATPQADGFLVAERLITHNGAPNCQGISVEYVARHFAPYVFIRVTKTKLTVLILDAQRKQHGQPKEFKRAGV
jgi:hypothetical protein